MKFDSTLFGELQRMVARPTPEPEDGLVSVTPEFVLALLPYSIVYRTAVDVTTVRTNSQQTTTSIRIANGAAVDTGMIALGKGIWRIQYSVSYLANYTNAMAAGTLDYQLYTSDPSGAGLITPISMGWALNGVSQVAAGSFDLPIDTDNWQIRLNLAANGVGNIHMAQASLTCLKIL